MARVALAADVRRGVGRDDLHACLGLEPGHRGQYGVLALQYFDDRRPPARGPCTQAVGWEAADALRELLRRDPLHIQQELVGVALEPAETDGPQQEHVYLGGRRRGLQVALR
ncbi:MULTISPECIES: hypothetical protein [Streptomyces]|uniref:hypothetical protein n=1 Tax=Streptomyces TaxID=1883 RepID=UPI00131814AF|nr:MULTISPECIES: hypothetical protein [Streptomyces]QGZ51650.1 hypothetical protein GPZ77_27620 [Streptomyces sp. QHH-9511]GGU14752.1 hypothetical protein GCM10010272_69650 [Streptomyces lateritius]